MLQKASLFCGVAKAFFQFSAFLIYTVKRSTFFDFTKKSHLQRAFISKTVNLNCDFDWNFETQ